MRPRYRFAPQADLDLAGILRDSTRMFGPRQRDRYAELVERAVILAAQDPQRSGSTARDDLSIGLRSFPVSLAAARHGAAAHVLYYEIGVMHDGNPGIVVIRILHHHMDPRRHISDSP
jgi:toxin ParE1/3/4